MCTQCAALHMHTQSTLSHHCDLLFVCLLFLLHYLTRVQDVANAIGAALGTVGAIVDTIESLVLGEGDEGESEKERVKKARLGILKRARERAIAEAVRKGAVRSDVYIQSENVVDVAYVKQKLRVSVKAVGPLCDSYQPEESVYTAVPDNPHWPYASAEDEKKDNAAKLTTPQVDGVCVCVCVCLCMCVCMCLRVFSLTHYDLCTCILY